MKCKYKLHRPSPIKLPKSNACKRSYVPPAPTTKNFPESPVWPVM